MTTVNGSRTRTAVAALAVAAALLSGACAGDLDKDPKTFKCAFAPPDPSCPNSAAASQVVAGADPECVAQVLETHECTSCHGSSAAATGGGLDLRGGNLGLRLTITPAAYQTVTNPAACTPGALVIDPVNPAASVLLKKVTATQDCGQSMPPSSSVSGADLECLRSWVMSFQ